MDGKSPTYESSQRGLHFVSGCHFCIYGQGHVAMFWSSRNIYTGNGIERLRFGVRYRFSEYIPTGNSPLGWCFLDLFLLEISEVDFFWNVGSPETEIDRLNDVGALVNPSSIGSWIDMSEKGGMDGGWFFPIEVPTKLSWDAADEGESLTKLAEWAKKHGIDRCDYLGRDMGAAPPRQTEVRFQPQGETFGEQVAQALSAYTEFGISPPPVDIINLIQYDVKDRGGVSLSVITSCEGFVRMGLMIPSPTHQVVEGLCDHVGGSSSSILQFQQALGVTGPAWVELQFLLDGFGYGVYREGLDVIFHFHVGSELPYQR
eukprot:TRINITY_DN1524_c0_g1_i9.p1 TRINITY_DN1524_c0_g1~~TRINITY_DN1524_c0_g1_i9.p1  ORF type:complete len:316 (-),score=58.66 TRINITY_DN1524_c0_g1_i9:598-1545(-)